MEDRVLQDGAPHLSTPVESREEQFRLMVEGIQDSAIYLLDDMGNVSAWNAGAERLYGYTATEIVGKSLSLIFPSEETPNVSHRLAIAQAAGKFEDEGWRYRKDGSRLWAKTSITPLADKTGQSSGYSVVVKDLTERRAAEEALRMSEARFEGIVRISEDAIISIGEDQIITMFNDGAEKIFGYRAQDVIGKKIDVLVPARFGSVHHSYVENFGCSPDSSARYE